MFGTTRVSRYQKAKNQEGKTNLDLLEEETVSGSGLCWAICKYSPHPDNHANIPPLSFLQAGCPSCRPTNSVKALKAYMIPVSSWYLSTSLVSRIARSGAADTVFSCRQGSGTAVVLMDSNGNAVRRGSPVSSKLIDDLPESAWRRIRLVVNLFDGKSSMSLLLQSNHDRRSSLWMVDDVWKLTPESLTSCFLSVRYFLNHL